eukprot:TRINITY_DN5201_c0_g1_i2.p1 TRINITY_DN5201_c0_g1~~TRINITY_DN5201_c0_g1_i2.p1  ORF type:complete len:813 (-),score=160.83 TRINITY_DN5201_c0_g1_i2:201-2615(-)
MAVRGADSSAADGGTRSSRLDCKSGSQVSRAGSKKRLADDDSSPRKARARRIATPALSPRAAGPCRQDSGPELTTSGQHLKVVGPESVQTLRGRMFGREIALILCGEAHEDTIDLTRRKGDLLPDFGWVVVPPSPGEFGFDFDDACATKDDATVQEAKKWAEEIVEKADSKDSSMTGASLVFYSLGFTKGTAAVFPPRVKRSPKFQMLPGTVVYQWADTDEQARNFNTRRLTEMVPVQEQDAMIGKRKFECIEDGFELFDDWLLRQVERTTESTDVHVEFIQEAPVSADEVELHVDPTMSPAPPAHECLRLIDLDSDEEADDEPHLGNGCYLDYLRRRTTTYLSQKIVHGVDPRVLGDAEDENLPEYLCGSFQEARFMTELPKDLELNELDAKKADWARHDQDTDVQAGTLPSFEAWLGGAADLLYHAPHVKADFSPFLGSCVGSTDSLWRFFEALYFETVPDAIAVLRLDKSTRPLACARSLAYRSSPGAALMRRPMGPCSDRRKPMPVRAIPVDRYLKARGFDTPRTWIAGLAERLREEGAEHFVNAAKTFYRQAVNRMLVDPKAGDVQGDNFVAWLRACYRDIFRDVDTSDPSKLQRKEWVESVKNPKSSEHEYHLKAITIPGFEKAYSEIMEGRKWTCPQCGKINQTENKKCQSCVAAKRKKCGTDSAPGVVHTASTVRQRMLSKMIVDAFALRSVDLAMILKIANIVSTAPADAPIVVVLYAGEDHTDSVAKFWRAWGFSHSGLPKQGKIRKAADADSNCLTFPSYLHDFGELFPLPDDVKDIALKMAQSEERAARRRT